MRTTEDCYRALGVLHTNWQMVPERFKDFISTPKANGYRSIHTTVIGPERQRVEVQIRTQEMHDIAERGVAAHWRYREHVEARDGGEIKALEWLREMVELLERGDSAEEFLEHSRLNMYQDQVFCFTPKGDLISLPRGATPIDFAYAVHTDLGNHCVGAKINGKHVPLHTPLRNGDQVEIIRTKEQTPSPLWEQFVVTGRARAEIRRFLRHAQRDEHVKIGRKILEKVFSDEGFELTDKAVEEVAKKLRLAKAEDVFAEAGRGSLRGHEVLEAVFPEIKRDPERRKQAAFAEPVIKRKPISIRGLKEGIAYRLGQCCHPLPGDRIVGVMTPGEGVVIHTVDCEELERRRDRHGRLARRHLGQPGGRGRAQRRAHPGAHKERAGLAGRSRHRDRQQRRQHLQPEGHGAQPALFRVHGRYRGARRGAFAEHPGRATRERRGRIGRARCATRKSGHDFPNCHGPQKRGRPGGFRAAPPFAPGRSEICEVSYVIWVPAFADPEGAGPGRPTSWSPI